MEESEREAFSLSYKWQFKTLDGVKFFGPNEGAGAWERKPDYPIRYHLWKVNREVWQRFDWWRISEEKVFAAAPTVAFQFEQLRDQISEFEEGEAPKGDDVGSLIPPTLLKERTLEMDMDLDLLEDVDQSMLLDIGQRIGLEMKWSYLMAFQSLNCVQNGVQFLGGGDLAMAGVAAIKAREWLLDMNFEVGYAVSADDQKRELAQKGADAAHAENRRLKRRALELYEAGNWPSYMQAARAISAQVHRAELVVLRWIKAHRDSKAGT